MNTRTRSMIMLLMVGGPIVALLFALAPDTRQPLHTQVPTNSSRNGTEPDQPPPFSFDGINYGDTVSKPDDSREKYAQELALRATLAEEAQGRWAKWQGIAGIIGVFAAIALLLYTHFTLDSTAKALLMQHRPTLVVRNIMVDGIDTGVLSDTLTNCRVLLANTGQTRATLIKAHGEWMYERRLPMENPVSSPKVHHPDQEPTVMEAGAIKTVALSDFTFHIEGHEAIFGTGEPHPDAAKVFVVGYAKYRDELGTLRRTYFCRRFDRAKKRFVPVDDPAYEFVE